jgi:hypothetical protein
MAGKGASAKWLAWLRAALGRLAEVVRARPGTVAWAVAGTCLAGWIGWECMRPLEARGTTDVAAQRNRTPSLPQVAAIAPELLNILQQRVLFKARNQVASNASVQATAQELRKKLTLRGISQQGQTFAAYIEIKGEGIKHVAAGDKAAEFTVVQVDARGVRLQLGSEYVVLGF